MGDWRGWAVIAFLTISQLRSPSSAPAQYFSNVWSPGASNSPNWFAYDGVYVTNVNFGCDTNVTFNVTNPVFQVFNLYADRTNIEVLASLPPLPAPIVVTNSAMSNICVYGSLTAGCFKVSLNFTNFGWGTAVSSVERVTNTTDCCTNDYTYVLSNLPPCRYVTINSNTVITKELQTSVACLTNPPVLLFPINFVNGTAAFDCLGTGVLQSIVCGGVTNGVLTNGIQVVSWQFSPATNSDQYVATNILINAERLRVRDVTLASGERRLVENATLTQAVFGSDGRMESDERANLVLAKNHVLVDLPNYAVRQFADTNGQFGGYCATACSNFVWVSQAGAKVWDGMNVTDGTNEWREKIFYRPPPQWPPLLTLTNGFAPLVENAAAPLYAPATTPEELALEIFNLPRGYLEVGITNTSSAFPGWMFGQLFTETLTNGMTNVTTSPVLYGSFFSFTPDFILSTPAGATNGPWLGRGHVVTNTYEIANRQWAIADLTAIATNYLTLDGMTSNKLAVPYIATCYTWTNGANWLSPTNLPGIMTNANASVALVQVFSNKAYWTAQTLSLAISNWIATNFVESCCVTNTTSYEGTNIYLDGSLIHTNVASFVFTNLAEIITTNAMPMTLTNVASVRIVAALETWNGQTNIPCGGDGSGNNVPMTNLVSILFSNVFTLPQILTNSYLQSTNILLQAGWTTNITAVSVNWNVAAGYHEIDYGWDGVRLCQTSMVLHVDVPAVFWFSTTNQVASGRYGTNSVDALVNTLLYGQITPACVASDALANAALQLAFTNNPIGNTAPYGVALATRAANASCGYFRKDTYTGAGYEASAAIGSTGAYCVACVTDITTNDSSAPCDGTCPCDPITLLCINFIETDTICQTTAPYPLNTCADLTNFITIAATGCIPGNFGDPIFYETIAPFIPMWHGYAPANVNACCLDTSANSINVTIVNWTTNGIDTQDGSSIGYIPDGTAVPAPSSEVSANYQLQSQSSAGVFADISTNYTSRRDLYLQGTPLVHTPATGPFPVTSPYWYNAAVAGPVTLSLTAAYTNDPTIYLYITNSPDANCQLATYQYTFLTTLVTNAAMLPGYILVKSGPASALPGLSYFGNSLVSFTTTVQTFPTYSVTDIFTVAGPFPGGDVRSQWADACTNCLTNANWSTAANWPASLPPAYDNTNAAGIYALITNGITEALSSSNYLTVPAYLSSNTIFNLPTPVYELDAFTWSGVFIIENYGMTNGGFKFQ